MSRVEDDHGERRAEEARLADLRAQERLKKKRTEEATAFDRAMAERAAAGKHPLAFRRALDRPQPPPLASRDPQKEAKAESQDAADHSEAAARQEQGAAERSLVARQAERRLPGQLRGEQQAAAQKASEQGARQPVKDAPDGHAQTDHEARSEDMRGAAAAMGRKGGPVKRASDQDASGGGSGQDQGNKGGGDSKPAAFRLPPAALMAPPPLARPKEAAAARLSSVTKEIVEKIVARVLVGRNTAGMAEFRIDLKSSVLKGLSIKVSGGRGGKIRAVFSGSDKEILAALKRSSSELVQALSARGLTLEDLEFDER